MNPKGKEWIKKNWYRVALHVFPLIVLLVVVDALLNIWIDGLSNKASVGWNIFITVAAFGALIWITLTVFIYRQMV